MTSSCTSSTKPITTFFRVSPSTITKLKAKFHIIECQRQAAKLRSPGADTTRRPFPLYCMQCSTRFTGLYGLYPDNLEQDAHSKSLACHDCPLPLDPTCAIKMRFCNQWHINTVRNQTLISKIIMLAPEAPVC